MNSKLRKIINNYGILNQLKYFQTEVFELNEAIINEKKDTGAVETIIDSGLSVLAKLGILDYKSNSDKNKEQIAEEIADVMVMLKQFQLYYDISNNEIKEIMDFKVERQLERIEGVKK